MSTPFKTSRDGEHNDGRYWRDSGCFIHRLCGPAVELDNGHKEWWLKGKCIAWQPSHVLPPHTPYTYMGARSDLLLFLYRRVEP
jgi:hypothetical protein